MHPEQVGHFSWLGLGQNGIFLAVPRGCLRFMIVVFPDHTNLLFLKIISSIPAM